MPVYKDENRGSWYFAINYRDENGKRKQKKQRGFKTKKEAAEVMKKLEYELTNNSYMEPSNVLFKDYLLKWAEYKKNSVSNHTYGMYKSSLKNHIQPLIGDIPISKLKPFHIQQLVTALFDKELSSTSVRRNFEIVSACLNYAVKVNDIQKNPAANIEKPKASNKKQTIWDLEQIRKFLNNAKGERLYCAFYLAIMTGLRQGEILGLRWSDVDFDNMILHVNQTLEHNSTNFKSGAKTEQSIRSVALSQSTIEVLKQHKEEVIAKERDLYGQDYSNLDLVICSSVGTPMNSRNLLRVFYRLIKKSNVPKIRFHDLRHTHASIMIMQNEPLKLISERLGHSKITTTMDTYGHLLPNMQHEASNRLDKTLFNS